MSSGESISDVLEECWRRWGTRSLRLGKRTSRWPDVLTTCQQALDDALGGGLPCGAISEIIGVPTSGASTLAFTIIANTQRRRRAAAVIDIAGTFDADYAASCGIALADLPIGRPRDADQAFLMLAGLIDAGASLIMVDSIIGLGGGLGRIMPSRAVAQLLRRLRGTGGAIMALTSLSTGRDAHTPAGRDALGRAAELRLHVVAQHWRFGDACTAICQSRIATWRRGRATGSVDLPITLPLLEITR
jgi:hypothetical protein